MLPHIMICEYCGEQGEITAQLARVSLLSSEQIRIDISFSLTELIALLDQGRKYDLLMLDAKVLGKDSSRLSRHIQDGNVKDSIIYSSLNKEYIFQLLELQTFSRVKQTLDRAGIYAMNVGADREQSTRISINGKEGKAVVCVSDILYVENIERSAYYVMQGGKRIAGVCNRASFEESVRALAERTDFIQPHKSYFVNLHWVEMVKADSLALVTGEEIPISRCRKVDTRRRCEDYFEQRTRLWDR